MPTYWDAFIKEMNKQNIKLNKLHIATVLELFFYYCNNRPENYNKMLAELHITAIKGDIKNANR